MRRKRRSIFYLPLIGLCTILALEGFGQHNDLVHVQMPITPSEGAPVGTPITDDGDDLSQVLTAGHLLVSFKGNDAEDNYHLEVLDERGRCLLTKVGVSRKGNNYLPLDMTALEQGRYLVRVQYAGATRQSRFLRP